MSVSARLRDELAALSAYHAPAPGARIKLDANELSFPWSDAMRARIGQVAASVSLERYPDPTASQLRAVLASFTQARPDELVIGCGSDELIELLHLAFAKQAPLSRPKILVVSPSFVVYRLAATRHGYEVIDVPLREDFSLDAAAMAHAIDVHKPSLVWLASPNNPTGNAFDVAVIDSLITSAPSTLFILDEAYAAYTTPHLSPFFGRENVALMGTLSKIGLAALRVGWARLPQWLAHEIEKVRAPFNLNALSQAIACLALAEGRAELEAHVQTTVQERARLFAALSAMPQLRVHKSDANFFLVDVPQDMERVLAALKANDIAVRAFGPQSGRLAQSLRVTVGTPSENDALIAALSG